MKIELRIDRLVVDAGAAGAQDVQGLQRAVEQALARRLSQGGPAQGMRQATPQGAGLAERLAASIDQALASR